MHRRGYWGGVRIALVCHGFAYNLMERGVSPPKIGCSPDAISVRGWDAAGIIRKRLSNIYFGRRRWEIRHLFWEFWPSIPKKSVYALICPADFVARLALFLYNGTQRLAAAIRPCTGAWVRSGLGCAGSCRHAGMREG